MNSATAGTTAPVSPEIAQFLENLNAAWLTRDYAALERFYHTNVVLLPPDAGAPLVGRDAVIATYRDFHSVCTVERFSVTEVSSWRFDADNQALATSALATTIVHMRFEIDYRFTTSDAASDPTAKSAAAPVQAEQGMDVYTLQHSTTDESLVIVWRAQFTL